jgi:hypothetical protein
MKRKSFSGLFMVVLALVLGSTLASAEKGGVGTGMVTSGLDDQAEVAITVYNVNLGLVKDQRTINLPVGKIERQVCNLSSDVNVATVPDLWTLTRTLPCRFPNVDFLDYSIVIDFHPHTGVAVVSHGTIQGRRRRDCEVKPVGCASILLNRRAKASTLNG